MTAKRTKTLQMIVSIAGAEQSIPVTVDYLNIPGNPERADEPARQPSVEILCCRVPMVGANGTPASTSIDIGWMFDEATTRAIVEELL